MIKSTVGLTGKLTVTVFDSNGNIKRHAPGFWRRLFRIPGKLMISVNHNIVTDEGDAMVADLMSQTPARQKLDNTHGFVPVGTGYTGTSIKSNTFVNAVTGTPKALSATYPKQKGSWGAANDNVVQYRALYAIGDLSATINEAALTSAATDGAGDCLAYAQVVPNVIVASTDSLQVDWELTALGA